MNRESTISLPPRFSLHNARRKGEGMQGIAIETLFHSQDRRQKSIHHGLAESPRFLFPMEKKERKEKKKKQFHRIACLISHVVASEFSCEAISAALKPEHLYG
jgi:hypothetical protein